MKTTKQIGDFGEEKATEYLRKRHWRILSRNYSVRGGEIDIIGYKCGALVFFEVKTRSNESYGKAYEAVDEDKLEKIKKAAGDFMKTYCRGGRVSVFYPFGIELKRRILKTRTDIIEVYLSKENRDITLNHIKDWGNQL